MTTKKQIVLSATLVAFALVVVLIVARGGDESASAGSGGQEQMAMAGENGRRPVRLDAESARRIGVTFATVEREVLDRTVSTVATVSYDETRITDISLKIDGWIERLYVDFTGAPVRRGQPLLEIYSPMLVSAQEELILARRLSDESGGNPDPRAAERSRNLLEAARRRLAYWDIPSGEIARIERSGVPQKTLTLTAPNGGVVVEKNVFEGSRIAPGMNLYRIADLSRVWVEGEVFEKDLGLVRLGQTARVTVEAYPGREFLGTVTYVYPSVSMESRTGRVRIQLANPELALKPGMYAKVELTVLGSEPRLVVPREAVHATGERSYVFARLPDGMLAAREVTTGLVAGRKIEILTGLAEGESVVASANFLIDAESSMGSAIEAMPGMDMGPGDADREE
jgi:Cu(I)/Ag(I) efflux system membrane fusion protein